MKICSFLIHYNRKTDNLECLSDCFAEEWVDADGMPASRIYHNDGHDVIYDRMSAEGLDRLSAVILGSYSEDGGEDGCGARSVVVMRVRAAPGFDLDNRAIVRLAMENGTDLRSENEKFLSEISAFIAGAMAEPGFREVLKAKVSGMREYLRLSDMKRARKSRLVASLAASAVDSL